MNYETLLSLHDKRLAKHDVQKHIFQPVYENASLCSLCLREGHAEVKAKKRVNRKVECCQDCWRELPKFSWCDCGSLSTKPLKFRF